MCGTEFAVDLLEEGLVEEELLLVHLRLPDLDLLLLHLPLQVVLVVPVDTIDLVVQATLLFRVIPIVLIPHVGLLVVQSLLLELSAALVLHLLG